MKPSLMSIAAILIAGSAHANLHTPMMPVNAGLTASCTVVNYTSSRKTGRLLMWNEYGTKIGEVRYDIAVNGARNLNYNVQAHQGFPAPILFQFLRCTSADDSGSDSGLRLSMCQWSPGEQGVLSTCVSDKP